MGSGDFLAQAATALTSAAFWRLLWFTTWQAALSTLLTVLAGLPLAYIFARFDFPGKRVLHALLTIPFVMPTVVVATAFMALIGRTGLLNEWLQRLLALDSPPIQLEQTIWLILIVHVFYNVAIIIRTVGGFWSNLNQHLNEAAAVLGATPWQVWRTVTLPLLLPSILAASLLVFLFCFTSFGVILILGGPRFATIEVEIYRQAVSYFNLPLAAFLSIVQLGLTFSVMVVYTRLQARLSRTLRQRRPVRSQPPRAWRQWALVIAALLVTAVGLLAPLAALVVRSFTLGDQGSTLRYYQALTENPRQSAFFAPPITAVANSLTYALATLAISLPLGVISAYMLAQPRSRTAVILDPLLLLPLGTSAVTLGFGYIVAMGPLRASPWLTPIAHALIALPFVVRTFLPARRALDQRLQMAAATLGAAPWQRWWTIDAPLLTRALAISAAFAFAISLGEFGATLLVARPDRPTMPMVIYQALGRPGLLNYGQALAMSTILMVVTAAALLAIERFRLPGEEEF
ncbi:MAG TPA: iron ABC transporter permease [Chloroflexi bacterium]|nr:iron ABC transporter permease [Chloroflexota bacterium]